MGKTESQVESQNAENSELFQQQSEHSFFGCIDEADDLLEDSLNAHVINVTSDQISPQKSPKSKLESNLKKIRHIWDKVPNSFQGMKTDQKTKVEHQMGKPIKLPFCDSNLLTVSKEECILYNQLFFNVEQKWCDCEGKHMLPIQNPFDVKRLRSARKILNCRRIVGISKNMKTHSLRTLESASKYNSVQPKRNSLSEGDTKTQNYSKRISYISNSADLSSEIPQNPSPVNSEFNAVQSYCKTNHSSKVLGDKKQGYFTNPIEKQISQNKTTILKRPQQGQHEKLGNLGCKAPNVSPLRVKNKDITRIKVDCGINNGGTPERLEETKRLRAKIKEEQLLRLKKQNENKNLLINKLVYNKEGWRKGDNRQNEMVDSRYSKHSLDENTHNKHMSHISKTDLTNISMIMKNACTNKDNIEHGDVQGDQTKWVKEVKTLNRVPMKLSARTIASRLLNLELENENTSFRISKQKSLPAKPFTADPNYGFAINGVGKRNIANSCITPISMFKEFSPVKNRKR